MNQAISWLDERLGAGKAFKAIFLRHIPIGVNWWYSLGSAALFIFILQVVTGTLLAMNYVPSPDHAYDSIRYIMSEVTSGWFVRGLHHWGATAMVAIVILHLVSVFVMGAHRYPREVIWLFGVGLLLVTVGFGFTGYLLPWDQKAYWATTVGTNMIGTVPGVGPALLQLVRGGTDVGAVTLTRFYAMHVMLFPVTITLLAAVHFVLVIYHGVSVSPGLWHRGVPGSETDAGANTDAGAGTKEAYQERYASFKAKGPYFWPDLIAEDLRVALVLFLILIGLSVLVGVPLDERADPTDTAYIPRPEWYFMGLFELLKYFPGALEWVGVVLVPSLLVVLLLATPWLSRGAERRPLKRPVGMAVLSVVLAGSVFLTVRAYQTTPPSVVEEHGVVLTSQQLRGRQLIQQVGCRSCHFINGDGDTEKGPGLDGINQRLTSADVHLFMENPKQFNPEATMKPLIPTLTHEDVEAITQYLLTLDEEAIQQ